MAHEQSKRPTPRPKTKPQPRPAPQKAPAQPRARVARAKASQKVPQKVPQQKAPALRATRGTPLERPRPAVAPRGGTGPAPEQRRRPGGRGLAVAVVACAVALVLAVGVGLAYLLLRDSSVFEITSVEAEPTEHVSETDIANLVQVPVGSTLLNVDTDSIEEALLRDPWVASVSFELVFPNTLRIVITEQVPDMLVVMSTGSVAWYLGDAGVWIQPTSITTEDDQSVTDAALEIALAEGCLLVTDVPSTVDPVAGYAATDEVLEAVMAFREGFSEEFSSQIVCYSAPSADNVSCTLSNGVQVSLGSATNISEKEALVTSYLEKYPDTATYINVRVVTNASVRTIDSDTVQAGSGIVSSQDEDDDTEVTDETTQTTEGTESSEEGSTSGSDEG